tara:strand:- start:154 stop:315 length:162 start_codon:yes stop_codon:yes gene_type:complete
MDSIFNVENWIKTPCGREKFKFLSKRKGFLSKIRLAWFIVFAIIKDWNISNEN